MSLFNRLLALLTPREQWQAGLLLLMVLVMAFLDLAGIASIMPFIAVLTTPELLHDHPVLRTVFHDTLGLTDPDLFVFVFGCLVFALLVASLAFKALTSYAMTRFTLRRELSLGRRLMAGYLNQPYAWFLNRHSADIGKIILSEVHQVVNHGMMPAMHLMAHGAVVIAILGLLVVLDPQLMLTVAMVLGTAYGLTFWALQAQLKRLGERRGKANKARYQAVSEAFGASKEIKVGGLEAAYLSRFTHPAQTFADLQSRAQVMHTLPRFALEAIAFGGMLVVVLYLLRREEGFVQALPMISLYAFAGYRLMPAVQAVYSALSELRFVSPAVDELTLELAGLKAPIEPVTGEVLPLQQSIRLDSVSYRYPGAQQPAITDLSLVIPARQTIGVVGVTGSGKTTLIDLILGLLAPTSGTVWVDDCALQGAAVRTWQRTLGYVPQSIYLADDSIAANIAFGVDPAEIDHAAVIAAAQMAQIHTVITEQLPNGYQTAVGERGVRLSGGQRQRIGIARALYHRPQVLIMDEATSALDAMTEDALMTAIDGLHGSLTVIVIAHRLSTIKACDRIYVLGNGRLVDQGDFDALYHRNPTFRGLAGGSEAI